ncbi:ABC transporter permease [Rhodanobacter glycinis]|uniref:Sodium transport system permease protein n=1 Tax=Rhodanobacter glycinis TaxID=582702 RepID=A0A1I3YZY1_9GAMM|nr:ABC transporter permease [Rhodanobacter glycinis]SFK37434.1 sodium transport system permease protein [Rhodanobacter glycinis]
MKTLTVFLKEVKESLRDKRTVLSALLYGPLIGPIVMVMLISTTINHQMDRADQPLKVPVIGAQYAPHLIDALKQQGLVLQSPPADPDAAVRNQDADVVLRIPSNYGKAWTKGEVAQVELIYDSSQRDANAAEGRLAGMLKTYAGTQGAMRLVARGLSPELMMPLRVDARDQSTPQSRAGMMFGILPYFFVITVLVGGMYLAIDFTAGERERQSLEPLFANPLPRWKILLGKLGAICTFSLASLLICVVAFAVAGRFLPTDKMGMTLNLGFAFAGRVFLLMLPLVLLFAALQTLVAGFAKTYREAQTYLSLLMVVPMLPSMLLTFMPVKTVGWMYAVPLLGQQVGITQLLRGGAVGMPHVMMCLVSGFVVALLVTLATVWVYRSERLAISA